MRKHLWWAWLAVWMVLVAACGSPETTQDVVYAEIPVFPDTSESDQADSTDVAAALHDPLQMACMLDGALPGLGLAGIGQDAEGNLYLGGAVQGTVDFDFGPGERIEVATAPRFFVAKYRRDCAFAWARLLDASVVPSAYLSFAVDSAGNSYLMSQFKTPANQPANFNPDSGYDLHAAKGGSDIFVVAFAPDGVYRFSRVLGGDGLDRPYALAIDDKSNVYASVIYQGPVDFDWGKGSAVLHSTGPNDDAYAVIQFGQDGSFHWARRMPGPMSQLRTARPGEVLAFGVTAPGFDVDFGIGFDLGPFWCGNCAFGYITAIAADGSFSRAWFSSLGSGGGFADIAFDAAGNQYITGPFWGAFDFDDGPGGDWLTSISYGSAPGDFPSTDAFVRSIGPQDQYRWTHQVATAIGNTYSTASPQRIRARGDSVLVAGRYGGLIQDGSTFRQSSSDGADVFLFSAHTSNGAIDWGVGLGSNGDASRFFSPVFLDVAKDGRIALAGAFDGTADLDLGEGVHKVKGGGSRIFLATFDAEGCHSGAARACACAQGKKGLQTCDGAGQWSGCADCKAQVIPNQHCATTCSVPAEMCGKVEACSIYIDCGRCSPSVGCTEVGCPLPAPVVMADHLNHPVGLTVDATDVYVLNAGSLYITGTPAPADASVMRLPRNGQPAVTLATGPDLHALAADANAVYWFDTGAHAIQRYDKATAKIQALVTGVYVVDLSVDSDGLVFLGAPLAEKFMKVYTVDAVTGALGPGWDVPYTPAARIASDASGIYVANPEPVAGNPGSTIYQLGRQGGTYQKLQAVDFVGELALDAQHIYYAPTVPGFSLWRVPKNGFAKEAFGAQAPLPWGHVAVANGWVYGAIWGQPTQSTWEGQVLAWDSKDSAAFVLARGLNHPTALAVDAQGAVFVAELGGTSVSTTLGRVLRLP